ncbi:MAG: hypothetical protein ONB23_10150 [candidate division KSB1 bacterium]|nr:hypothetical protein [candidate division KSB1 bacterium]
MALRLRSALIGIVLILGATRALWAQEPMFLVDEPTAGILPRGVYQMTMRLFSEGGVLVSADVGLGDRFLIGLSYGGERIIGRGQIRWYPQPGVHVRLRLVDENRALPALSLGFHSQGYGRYLDDLERYEVKSRGFFAAASKHYRAGVLLGIHGGLNYSLEDKDGDRDLNVFLGGSLALSRHFELMSEYDLAWNDNGPGSRGRGRGFLHAGCRWWAGQNISIDFVFYDLVRNQKGVDYAGRFVVLRYWEHL